MKTLISLMALMTIIVACKKQTKTQDPTLTYMHEMEGKRSWHGIYTVGWNNDTVALNYTLQITVINDSTISFDYNHDTLYKVSTNVPKTIAFHDEYLGCCTSHVVTDMTYNYENKTLQYHRRSPTSGGPTDVSLDTP